MAKIIEIIFSYWRYPSGLRFFLKISYLTKINYSWNIHIWEIRSKYAASAVLRVSLGSDKQIVVATIHGFNVVTALDRLLTWAREIEGAVAAQNLAQSLLGIFHQELHTENGNRELNVPEFLLLPFAEESVGVRSKLRSGKLISLQDDMREQRNRLLMHGLKGVRGV